MKKSFNTTLILVAVLVFLGVWYKFYEKKYKVEQTEKEEKTKRLTSFEQDQVSELQILKMINAPKEGGALPEKPEYETIVLTKKGADWAVVKPIEDLADSSNVTSTLSTLTTSKQERVVDENPKELKQYGLDSPIIKATLKKADGTSEDILLGLNTPVGFSIYAKTSKSPNVFKMSRSLKSSLEKEVFQYRNKQIVPWKKEEVGEIEIQKGTENLVLKKGETDQWNLARENVPADLNEVNKSLNALIDLKAQSIATDDPKDLSAFGLKNPTLKVTIQKPKETTRFSLAIGKGTGTNKDKYYVRRDDKPTVYEVGKSNVDPLERPSSSYRNMNAVSFNRFDVKHIKLEKGDASFELIKNETGWTFAGDATTKVDTAQVDSYLTKVQDSKVLKYLQVKTSDRLKTPKLVLRLFNKKDAAEVEAATLTFSSAVNKEVHVLRNGLDTVFTMKEEDFNHINAPKTSFVQQDKKS